MSWCAPGCARRSPLRPTSRWSVRRIEREVLHLVAHGHAAREIGEQLGLAPEDVEGHRQGIKAKTGLGHRSEYIRIALKLGLLTAGSVAAVAHRT